jgi:hypothetical protein
MGTFPDENTSGGMFVLTNVELPRDKLPFVIHDDVVLREARESEIQCLEKGLEAKFGYYGQPSITTEKYKGHILDLGDGRRKMTTEGYDGPHRFWVIAYHGVNNRNTAIHHAGLLVEPQLTFGFGFTCKQPEQQECFGCDFDNNLNFSRFRSDVLNMHDNMNVQALERFRDLYTAIEIDKSIPERAGFYLSRYAETFQHDWYSEVLVLLYSSLVEAILTHQPKPTDPTDSLTRQISSKMKLVSKRFDRRIEPGDYFTKHTGQLGTYVDLWRLFYGEVRSKIAHGNEPCFDRGKASKLESIEAINKYLHDTVRELIKLYLMEPDLMTDLKDC